MSLLLQRKTHTHTHTHKHTHTHNTNMVRHEVPVTLKPVTSAALRQLLGVAALKEAKLALQHRGNQDTNREGSLQALDVCMHNFTH
jgi:hypothetical protein